MSIYEKMDVIVRTHNTYIDSINEKITEMSKNLLSDFSEEEKAALVATLEKLQIKLNKTLKQD